MDLSDRDSKKDAEVNPSSGYMLWEAVRDRERRARDVLMRVAQAGLVVIGLVEGRQPTKERPVRICCHL